jgi:peptidoglycan-associated lipoprotein
MHQILPNHMKSAQFCKLVILSLVLSLGLAGCRKGPKAVTTIPGKTTGGIGDAGRPSGPERLSPVPDGGDAGRTKLTTTDGMTELPGGRWDKANFNEDRNQFREQTVYFEFDKSTIKSSEQAKIQAVATYLKSEPKTMLDVEGHCDERGTAGYNLSLGERRALAVREYLISLGIIGERINTVSYGEDRPAAPGHDESAWAKNRRSEFILLRPKQ